MVEGARVRRALTGALAVPAVWALLLGASAMAELTLPGPGSCDGCNVVIVSIDTLRADRLEPFGYERPTSPELDRLASRGIIFERAYSTSLATAEAHMSLFTSLYPSVHGVRTLTSRETRPVRLSSGIPTLAALLRERGYATAGFHEGGNVNPAFGFDRGFEVYENATFMSGPGWKATRDWLQQVAGQRFFLFLHTYHAHDPYTPEASSRRAFADGYEGEIVSDRQELNRLADRACEADPECTRWRLFHRIYWSKVDRERKRDIEHLSDLYDAEIREVDNILPRLMATLEAMPGDTLVLFLSDHGEAFLEHGSTGHSTLHEEVLRIPIVLLHPRAKELAGRRFSAPVSLVDVAPWVLRWLGVERPASFQGGESVPEAAAIFAEYPAAGHVALVRGSLKILLQGHRGPLSPAKQAAVARAATATGVASPERFHSVELFDLEQDPGERRDLGVVHPEFEPMLRAALERVAANRVHQQGLAPVPASRGELSPEMRAQLEALGYMD